MLINSAISPTFVPYSCTSSSSGNTIPTMEGNLIKSLTDYYSCIINLKDSDTIYNCESQASDYFNNYYMLSGSLKNFKRNTRDGNVDLSKLTTQHGNIIQQRNQLDIKLKEINKSQDSAYSMYKAKYDSTMYSSIIWTILATALIYYIFVKL